MREATHPVPAIDGEALERVGTALADATRRSLLLALLEGPAAPSELAVAVGASRSNVSNHLTCLRGCGLVTVEREGRTARYQLADPRLAHALADLAGMVVEVDPHHPHREAE